MTPEQIEASLCECDRPDESDNPHRHTRDMACIYWLAGRPSRVNLLLAFDGELPLTSTKPKSELSNTEAPDGKTPFGRRVARLLGKDQK